MDVNGLEKPVGDKIHRRWWLIGYLDGGERGGEDCFWVCGLGNWTDGGATNREGHRAQVNEEFSFDVVS